MTVRIAGRRRPARGCRAYTLADIAPELAEATVAEWYVTAGARMAEGADLVDVVTDKATVTLAMPVTGVVKVLTAAREAVVTGASVLCEIEAETQARMACSERKITAGE